MIRLDSMSSGYGSKAVLNDISFEIGDGEMVGVLGPNGSGKTTLLLTLAGIIKPLSGEVELAKRPLQSYNPKELARLAASVPQKVELGFPFSCFEVVLMGRYPHLSRFSSPTEEDRMAASKAMAETDTLDFVKRRITEISGGEGQRVIIARALAQQASLMLLDEATSSLDAFHKIMVFDLFKRKNLSGTTLILAMHDLNLAALYCPRLIFLKDGLKVLDGPTRETFTEEKLKEVYGTELKVVAHPTTGAPQAFFVPQNDGSPNESS